MSIPGNTKSFRIDQLLSDWSFMLFLASVTFAMVAYAVPGNSTQPGPEHCPDYLSNHSDGQENPNFRSSTVLNLSKYPMLKEKTIIGIGEVAHGSRGLHALEAELVRSAVTEFGTRLVGLEAPMGIVAKINEKLSPQSTSFFALEDMSELYSVWKSPELFDLLQWVYKFNHDPANIKNPVVLIGYDIRLPYHELKQLVAWSNANSVSYSNPAFESIDSLRELEMAPSKGQAQTAKVQFQNIESWLNTLSAMPGRTDEIEFLISRLKGWVSVYLTWSDTQSMPKSYAERDKQMFWLFKKLKSKSMNQTAPIVLIAHLNHLLFNNLRVQESKDHVVAGPVFGNYLFKEYGQKYSLVGLFAKNISITNSNGNVESFKASNRSLESLLQTQFPGKQLRSVMELDSSFSNWITVGDVEPKGSSSLNSYSTFKMLIPEQMDFIATIE